MVGSCNRCSVCSQCSNIALIGCCISKTAVIVLNDTVLVRLTEPQNLNGTAMFDGIAGCLRTPSGGSSRQYIIIKDKSGIHARLLTVREAARLMGAPDNFLGPGSYNDGYKAMGDAVAMPVAKFIGERFLVKLAEVAYHD